MTNRKSTKKALLMSALSLLLCFSMLVGTTFAWFTDSVESGTNQILAGNLDVEVYNSLTVGENKVDSNTKLFNEITYWEPGVVAYENLTVANLGTLALKYQLSVNFTDATATPDGKTLADVLKVGFVQGGIKSTTREGALDEVNGNWLPLESFIQSGSLDSAKQDLTAAEVSDTYGIVIYWEPSDKDNDYNMNHGEDALSINLGIKLIATQLMAEEDSFGDDYDANAILPWDGSADTTWYDADETEFVLYTAEELAGLAALINGGNNLVGKTVKLGADIDLAGRSWTPINLWFPEGRNNLVIDGNGHTISNMTVLGTKNGVGFISDMTGNVTIQNLTFENASVVGSGNFIGTVVGYQYGNLVLINVDVVNSEVYSTAAIGIRIGGLVGFSTNDSTSPATIKLENCDVSGTTITGYHNLGGLVGTQMNTNYTYTNCSVKDCTIYARTTTEKYVDEIAVDGGAFTTEYSATVANNTVVCGAISNAAQLAALGGTKISGTYVLAADIDMSGYDMKPILVASKETLTFIGNGHTISNLKLVASNSYGMTGSGNEVAGLFDMCENSGCSLVVTDLNIANVSIDIDGGYAAAIVGYAQSSNDSIILTNVDVNGANISADSVSALVGYSIGTVTLTGCDVSNITLICEENRPEKVGAYVGTANQATCVVTATNCTNDTAYKYAGRVINGATMTIDSVSYVTDADGLATAVKNGATNVLLASGEYDMPNFGQGNVNGVKFIGESNTNTVIKLYNVNGTAGDFCLDGSTATLENLKIVTEIKDYAGFQNAKNLTFNYCEFENNLFLTGDATFNYCHFSVTTNHYNVWAYTAGRDYTADFNNCVFDCAGKSIYIDGNPGHTITMKFNGCTFNDNDGGATDKAAIETGTAYGVGSTYNVVIVDCEFNGFAAGKNTDSIIWANKNSMTADKLNITIDGVNVY